MSGQGKTASCNDGPVKGEGLLRMMQSRISSESGDMNSIPICSCLDATHHISILADFHSTWPVHFQNFLFYFRWGVGIFLVSSLKRFHQHRHGACQVSEPGLAKMLRGCSYYCWWKKSQTTIWDVQNHVNEGINYLFNWLAGCLPSTVGPSRVSLTLCEIHEDVGHQLPRERLYVHRQDLVWLGKKDKKGMKIITICFRKEIRKNPFARICKAFCVELLKESASQLLDVLRKFNFTHV